MKHLILLRLLYRIPMYILYVLITLEERNKYMIGEQKGVECTKIDHGFFYNTLHYDPAKKPVRNYITFLEFWAKEITYLKSLKKC